MCLNICTFKWWSWSAVHFCVDYQWYFCPLDEHGQYGHILSTFYPFYLISIHFCMFFLDYCRWFLNNVSELMSSLPWNRHVTVPLCEWIGSIVCACNICRDCEHQLSPSYSILLLVWPVRVRSSSCVTAPDTTVARQPPKFHNSIILQQLNTAPVHCGKHHYSNIQISV